MILFYLFYLFCFRQTLLRWFQGSYYPNSFGQLTPFAVNEFYVGFPCPLDCSGHGYCTSHGCECDPGYQGNEAILI